MGRKPRTRAILMILKGTGSSWHPKTVSPLHGISSPLPNGLQGSFIWFLAPYPLRSQAIRERLRDGEIR